MQRNGGTRIFSFLIFGIFCDNMNGETRKISTIVFLNIVVCEKLISRFFFRCFTTRSVGPLGALREKRKFATHSDWLVDEDKHHTSKILRYNWNHGNHNWRRH